MQGALSLHQYSLAVWGRYTFTINLGHRNVFTNDDSNNQTISGTTSNNSNTTTSILIVNNCNRSSNQTTTSKDNSSTNNAGGDNFINFRNSTPSITTTNNSSSSSGSSSSNSSSGNTTISTIDHFVARRQLGDNNDHSISCTRKSNLNNNMDEVRSESGSYQLPVPSTQKFTSYASDVAEQQKRDALRLMQNDQIPESTTPDPQLEKLEETSKILSEVLKQREQGDDNQAKATKKTAPRKRSNNQACGCKVAFTSGGGGGYTPSGWSKLVTLKGQQQDSLAKGPPEPTLEEEEEELLREETRACGDQPIKKVNIRAGPFTCACSSAAQDSVRIRNFYNSSNSRASCSDEEVNRPSTKILGELAFQLERRILDYVFGAGGSRRRFYGYTVSNICFMMEKECKNPKGRNDVISKNDMASRLMKLLTALDKYGYNLKKHGDFSLDIVNRYGLLPCPPDANMIKEFGLLDSKCIESIISKLANGPFEAGNLEILLDCLKYLAKCDGRPLFEW